MVLHNLIPTYPLQVELFAPSILIAVLQNSCPILSVLSSQKPQATAPHPSPTERGCLLREGPPKRIWQHMENKAGFAQIMGHEAKGNQKDHIQESFKITEGITSNSCIHSPGIDQEADTSYQEVG